MGKEVISRRYDAHACDTIIFFLMLETEELISEIGSHHILQEASELWSCNYKGVLAVWPHKHAGKHVVSVNNCCLQFF